jgi:hypothetical protein
VIARGREWSGWRALLVAACLGVSLGHQAHAASPLGGLAIAVTADGQRLVCAGDNRVLYELDPEALDVKSRTRIDYSPVQMAFNQDGSRLVAESACGAVVIWETQSWTRVAVLEGCRWVQVSPKANSFVCVEGGPSATKLVVRACDNGALIKEIALPEGFVPHAAGYSPFGDRLAVLSAPKPAGDSEPPQYTSETAGPMLNVEAALRADGQGAHFLMFALPSGRVLADEVTFFTVRNNSRLVFKDDDVLALQFSNVNAVLNASGRVKRLFAVGDEVLYGIGLAPNQRRLACGRLRAGAVFYAAGMYAVGFDLPAMEGWPEILVSFAVTDAGPVYGATSAFRVVKLNALGSVVKTVPIF